ncbi:hypothetical protein CORMATOL_02533 [Corynebacterium matruchotii ATCC 33806]|uniref:Uncharacterized protein n=1 Tax=Corynebacterium matruchotii ATCC 33806 TaxID=566549 RepID=C0E6A0_9CORY|nr:hypothetical protein CORMATOL_02533 [Corynebacterium matruchotii ATCC 33806]
MVLIIFHAASSFSDDLLIGCSLQRSDYPSSVEVFGNYMSSFN